MIELEFKLSLKQSMYLKKKYFMWFLCDFFMCFRFTYENFSQKVKNWLKVAGNCKSHLRTSKMIELE